MANSVFHSLERGAFVVVFVRTGTSPIRTRCGYSARLPVDLWHFQKELFANCSLLLICEPLTFGDESLPSFQGKSELLRENSGWSTQAVHAGMSALGLHRTRVPRPAWGHFALHSSTSIFHPHNREAAAERRKNPPRNN